MVNPNQDIRWRQWFQNYEKTYQLLKRTLTIKSPSEAERAGLIQFFEIASLFKKNAIYECIADPKGPG